MTGQISPLNYMKADKAVGSMKKDPRHSAVLKRSLNQKVQSGYFMISSGFSVQAEHAHQNQRKFPF